MKSPRFRFDASLAVGLCTFCSFVALWFDNPVWWYFVAAFALLAAAVLVFEGWDRRLKSRITPSFYRPPMPVKEWLMLKMASSLYLDLHTMTAGEIRSYCSFPSLVEALKVRGIPTHGKRSPVWRGPVVVFMAEENCEPSPLSKLFQNARTKNDIIIWTVADMGFEVYAHLPEEGSKLVIIPLKDLANLMKVHPEPLNALPNLTAHAR